MDVWILWGPEPVTARGEDRVQAVTIGKHGVQIARGRARGLLLPGVAVDHHLDALAFLQQVCIKAGLPTDAWKDDDTEAAGVRGRCDPRAGCSRTSPTLGRPPWPAASIPAIPAKSQRTVDELFAAAPPAAPQPWPGAMVPHAGWIYSGRLAAAVLQPRGDSRAGDHPLPQASAARRRSWAVAPHRAVAVSRRRVGLRPRTGRAAGRRRRRA